MSALQIKNEQAFAQWLSEAWKLLNCEFSYKIICENGKIVKNWSCKKNCEIEFAGMQAGACVPQVAIISIFGGGVDKCILWLSFAQQKWAT
jgi:hypothetical protein